MLKVRDQKKLTFIHGNVIHPPEFSILHEYFRGCSIQNEFHQTVDLKTLICSSLIFLPHIFYYIKIS